MQGFWTTTSEGLPVHIAGDPNMDEGTKEAILCAMEAAKAQLYTCTGNCKNTRRIVHITDGAYFLQVCRCLDCGAVFVDVESASDGMKLARIPCKVEREAGNDGALGWRYHWRLQGRWMSIGTIPQLMDPWAVQEQH